MTESVVTESVLTESSVAESVVAELLKDFAKEFGELVAGRLLVRRLVFAKT